MVKHQTENEILKCCHNGEKDVHASEVEKDARVRGVFVRAKGINIHQEGYLRMNDLVQFEEPDPPITVGHLLDQDRERDTVVAVVIDHQAHLHRLLRALHLQVAAIPREAEVDHHHEEDLQEGIGVVIADKYKTRWLFASIRTTLSAARARVFFF